MAHLPLCVVLASIIPGQLSMTATLAEIQCLERHELKEVLLDAGLSPQSAHQEAFDRTSLVF